MPDSGDVDHHPFDAEVNHLACCVLQNREALCSVGDAYHTHELKHDALQYGFDGYFAKPLNRTLFLGSIEDIMFK